MGWGFNQDPTNLCNRFATVELDNDGVKFVSATSGCALKHVVKFSGNNPITPDTSYFLELVVEKGASKPTAYAYQGSPSSGNGAESILGYFDGFAVRLKAGTLCASLTPQFGRIHLRPQTLGIPWTISTTSRERSRSLALARDVVVAKTPTPASLVICLNPPKRLEWFRHYWPLRIGKKDPDPFNCHS